MKRIAAVLLAAVLCQPAAHAVEVAALPPSPADDAQIDRLIDPFLAALKSGRTKQAVADYMGTNALLKAKATELDYVAVQADATIAAYGPIANCQLAEKTGKGSWTQTRLYLCQHEKYVTRWIFSVIKLPSGWQAATFRFDDKFTLDASQ